MTDINDEVEVKAVEDTPAEPEAEVVEPDDSETVA
jgi:hypothetical protein